MGKHQRLPRPSLQSFRNDRVCLLALDYACASYWLANILVRNHVSATGPLPGVWPCVEYSRNLEPAIM